MWLFSLDLRCWPWMAIEWRELSDTNYCAVPVSCLTWTLRGSIATGVALTCLAKFRSTSTIMEQSHILTTQREESIWEEQSSLCQSLHSVDTRNRLFWEKTNWCKVRWQSILRDRTGESKSRNWPWRIRCRVTIGREVRDMRQQSLVFSMKMGPREEPARSTMTSSVLSMVTAARTQIKQRERENEHHNWHFRQIYCIN